MKFKNYIETESGIKDTSTSPGTAGQVLSSTVTGTSWIDQGEILAAASKLVVIACKNVSGVTILKGTPVYQSGTVGATDVIEIEPADATISTGYLPAIGILQTTLNNNISGNVVITGEFLNYDTASIPTNNPGGVPITGDTVYLAPGGGLTCIKPTGAGNAIQNLGLIGKVSGGTAGSITVSSIMRANDVPNLPTGKIWVGDGNTTVSDTVYLDETNNRMGIGTAFPLGAIQIGDGTAIQPSTNEILVLSNIATTGGNSNLYLVTGPSGTSTIGMGASVTAAQNTAGKIIYSDAVDTFSFNTNFSTKMIINSEGNVGIGTTTASETLTLQTRAAGLGSEGIFIKNPFAGISPIVNSSSPFLSLATSTTSAYNSTIYMGSSATATDQESKIEWSNANDALSIYIKGQGSYREHVRFGNISSSTPRTSFAGNVGIGTIGTTNPSGKLEVRQAQNNGDTGAFTNTHVKLTSTTATDNTGFVGITAATSSTDLYGYSFGAQRTSGGIGSFKIN